MQPKEKKISELEELAHDLRNIIAAAYCNAQLLELRLQQQGLASELQIARAITASMGELNTTLTQHLDSMSSEGSV